MLITQTPFAQYTDVDGLPLSGGSLYFGQVGQNPRTSPVAIFWDTAGTQPAAQPVKTLGGYTVRNGSPSNVYTSGAYSVALYNAAGELVFYAPDSAAFDVVLATTTTFARSLLDDPDAATARATLGAAASGANSDITGLGAVTMTSPLTLSGNASNDLHAVPKQQAESIAGLSAALSFSSLALSATGTNANVSVSAAEMLVRDSSNLSRLLPGVALTINTASVGANGLDTGTLAGSTWYSVWVIWNGTTIAGLISSSATNPTMPSGYTFKARVGWIRTDATANKYPLSFRQLGRSAQYVVAPGSNVTALPTAASGAVASYWSSWGAVTVRGATAPSTAATVHVVLGSTNTTATGLSVAPNGSYGFTTAGGAVFYAPGTSVTSMRVSVGLESDAIYCSNQANTQVAVIGWEDNL